MALKKILFVTLTICLLQTARSFIRRSRPPASLTPTPTPTPISAPAPTPTPTRARTPTPPAAVSTCPHRWLAPPSSESCYRLWPESSKDWDSARETCQLYNADLLKLDSKEEKEWIIQEIMKYSVDAEWWIGLKRDPGDDKTWLWLDGSERNDSTSFLLWGSDEPNNFRGEEDCAEIWDNLLNDKNCAQLLQFICERPTNILFLCDVDNGWDNHGLNNCYKFFDEKRTMKDARKTCFEDDSELLKIGGEQEQEILTDFIKHENKSATWLKLSFLQVAESGQSYQWSWDLGSSAVDTQTDKWWNGGTPDKDAVLGNNTVCSVMYTNTTSYRNWIVSGCDEKHKFMCMKSLGKCPAGFRKNGGTCYRVHILESMRWNDARGYCNLRGTKIVEINSEAKQDFITSLLQSSTDDSVDVWIGLSGSPTDWSWDSGASLGIYEQNQLAAVNTSGCIYSRSNGDGKWYVDDCSSNKVVLCSVPEDQPIIPVTTESKPKFICPGDYVGPIGENCYRVVADSLDWLSARNACMAEGSDLAVIPSAEARNFLLGQISTDVWIGLNDRSKEGKHVWLDTDVEAQDASWKSYTQNINVVIGGKYSENCVSMRYLPGNQQHGMWMDIPCNFQRSFVCWVKGEWNVALGKVAYIYSNDAFISSDDKLVDGCTAIDEGCCFETRPDSRRLHPSYKETKPVEWVQLDLGTPYAIRKINVLGMYMAGNIILYITNSSTSISNASELVYEMETSYILFQRTILLPNVTTGRYIQIAIRSSSVRPLFGITCEIQVFEATTEGEKLASAQNGTEGADCNQGWIENRSTGTCYYQSKQPLTWADAENYCTNMNGYLAVPAEASDESFLAELFTSGMSGSYTFEIWMGASVSAGLTDWQTALESDYFRPKLNSELSRKRDSSQTSCALFYMDNIVPDGRPKSSNCLERKQFVCQDFSPFWRFKTVDSTSERSLQTPNSNVLLNESSLQFQIKGSNGARVRLNGNSSYDIVIILCSLKNKKSVIYENGVQKRTAWLTNLCRDKEYKPFYISWKDEDVVVGEGTDVGKNVFMSWSGHLLEKGSPIQVYVSSATTSDVFWKLKRDLEKPSTEPVESADVNIALGKRTTMSSSHSEFSTSDKAVDGCESGIYATECCLHTQKDFEPWWQVDLGKIFHIKEVIIMRRTECCAHRLKGFTVTVSGKYSSGVSFEKTIYTASSYASPPESLSIPTKAKGRYVKIQIPGRSEFLELCEVKVIQDMDGKWCEDGWHLMEYGNMKQCIFISDMRLSWPDARDFCRDHLASLGLPLSPEEQLFIFEQSMGKGFTGGNPSIWLGVHDLTTEGHFETVDGTSIGYRDWGKGEPNNFNNAESCVSLRLDYTRKAGQWNDSPCDQEMRFFCRENALTTTTSTTTTTVPTTTQPTVTVPSSSTILTTTVDPAAGVCEKGWTFNTATKACYKIFFDKNLNFFEAMKSCLHKNARLSSIESTAEQEFLKDMLKKDPNVASEATRYGTWSLVLVAGMEEKSTEGNWGWHLYDSGWFWGINWSENQPDDFENDEDCLGIRIYNKFLGEANDVPCTWRDANAYICKRTSEETMCPEDWLYDVRTMSCYKDVKDRLTWSKAFEICEKEGGALASIGSREDQDFLKAIVTSPSMAYWVGAHYTAGEPWLKWTDKTPWWTGTEFTSDQDAALGDKDLCGVFGNNLGLVDCGHILPFICKLKVTLTTPTSNTTSVVKTAVTTASSSGTAVTTTGLGTATSMAIQTSPTVGTPTSTGTIDQMCGKDWDRNPDTNNCYQFVSSRVSWDEASSICQEKAGNLVSVVTSAEQQYLNGRLHGISAVSKELWIGANNHDLTSGWRWSDGSPFAYFNWQPLQPDDFYGVDQSSPVRGCGALVSIGSRYFGKWNDPPCEDKKGFICKKVINQRQVTLVTPVVPSDSQYYGCPGNSWMSYGNSCFLVVQEKTEWQEARDYCKKEGAELASIQDANEQNFVFSQLPQDSYCFNIWRNNTQCTTWAERGECNKNPTWMATQCHHACKLCYHNCRDKYISSSKCTVWAQSGECDKNHPWMLKNCAQSCGVCTGAPTRGFWMGLQRKGYSRVYQWTDHLQVKYTNWNAQQPSGFRKRGQSCGAMFLQTGRWNDGECSMSLPGFVCKQPKQLLDKTTESPFKEGCTGKDSYGYGLYCYTYVSDAKTWDIAKEYCTRTGGSLANIMDIYVQSFVASELANLLQDYWIGLTVTNQTMTWTNNVNVPFTHFDKRFDGLTHTGSSCFAMRTFKPVGIWRPYDCATPLPFICQNLRSGITTTTTTTLSTTTLPPCESSWVEFNNFCYWLATDDDSKPWVEAEIHCSYYGASLASVMSFEENQFIVDQRPDTEPYIIGLNDRADEGVYEWSDGSPFTYSKWGEDEPNDYGDEDCSEIRWDGMWNDIPCFTARRFVCKIPKGKTVENAGKTPKPVFEACDGDPDWKAFGDKCYFLETESYKNWFDAKDDCKAKGGNLASLHSDTEQRSATSLISRASNVVWIGYNRLGWTGQYHWSDGSPVDFTKWDATQPNDIANAEKCAVMQKGPGFWHDYNCNDPKAYLCMKSKGGVTVPQTTTPALTIDGGCAEGFVGFGNKCYLIAPKQTDTYQIVSWLAAKGFCERMRSELVSIHSSLEQAFITTQLLGIDGGLWIGLNDNRDQDRFDWVDNSRLVYTNWDEEEPSTSYYAVEGCVEMYPTPEKVGRWNDVDCFVDRGYICATAKDPSLPKKAAEPDNDGCIAGYAKFGETCYKLNTHAASWIDSLKLCEADKAILVSIRSLFEQAFVEVLTGDSQTEVWTGGKYNQVSGFHWTGEESPSVFGSWSSTFSFSMNSCVSSSGQFWNSRQCDELLPSICKMPIAGQMSTTAAAPVNEKVCRDGSWLLYNRNCYSIVTTPATFEVAMDVCRSMDMMLASIHSQGENMAITGYLKVMLREAPLVMPKLWIGLTRIFPHGEFPFLWVDETVTDFLNFADYGTDYGGFYYSDIYEPMCVSLSTVTTKWNKEDCMQTRAFVCKGSADTDPADLPTSTTSTTMRSTTTAIMTSAPTPSDSSVTSKPNVSPEQHTHRIIRPVHEPVVQSPFAEEDDALTGGEIAGIVIGVIVGLFLIGVIIYTVYTMNLKRTVYGMDESSLGFDNALFHKNTETVSIDG